MDKKTLLAMVLSVLVILGWMVAMRIFYVPPPAVSMPVQVEEPVADWKPAEDASEELSFPPTRAPAGERTVSIETELYRVVLSSRGGNVVSYRLKGFVDSRTDGPRDLVELVSETGLLVQHLPLDLLTLPEAEGRALSEAAYEIEGQDAVLGPGSEEASVRLRFADTEGRQVEKRLLFRAGSHVVGVEVDVCLPDSVQTFVSLGAGFGSPDLLPKGGGRYAYRGRGIVELAGKFKHIMREKTEEAEVFALERPGAIGLESRYFASLFLPREPMASGVLLPVEGLTETDRTLIGAVRFDGRATRLDWFVGPKHLETMQAIRGDLAGVIDFGFFSWLARLLLHGLQYIYQIVGNFGVSIIILTGFIKVCFFPLTYKQLKTMQRMQKLRPQIKALEQKYSRRTSDSAERAKLNQQKNAEMMALYQREGVNPAAGCLPLLIQLPFLWAFYSLLGGALDLRQAPFALWIQDLSVPDHTYFLPILMGVSMVVQQALTPSTADPMQRRLLYVMPIVFTFLFFDFPAGLVIYWLTSNILGIAQQALMNRWHPPELAAAADGDGKGKLRKARARR